MRVVAKATPAARETAMGLIICACVSVSRMRGVSPPTVLIVVNPFFVLGGTVVGEVSGDEGAGRRGKLGRGEQLESRACFRLHIR